MLALPREVGSMKIAVLGSGKVGEVLANGFIRHGHAVMRGSRDPKKLAAWKEAAGPNAQIGSFADVARWGELAVLAVKGAVAEEVIGLTDGHLDGKPVLDATNPIADAPPENGVVRFFTGPNDSLMERLQRRAPAVHFVKAFNSIGNAVMVDPKLPGGPPTMFICGDSAEAKTKAKGLLEQLGWHVEDCGA